MFTSFKNLKPFQLAEYICMTLLAYLLPISWRLATYAMAALFLTAVLRGIFEEGFKPNPSQYKNKIACIIFVVFWSIYAVSFLYSENSAEARINIGRKLPFLLIPIYFLCSNLSYLTKERLRTIIYCLVFGILTLFVVNLIWAGYDVIFNDEDIERIISHRKFFKTNDMIFPYVHRAYFSMMTCVGFVFCFLELLKKKSIKLKTLDLLLCLFLVFVPFFMASRAGMLCTALVLFILWVWITFVKNERKIGILSGVTILCFLMIGIFVFRGSINRFVETYNSVKEGKGDCRLTIRKGNRTLIAENFLFGVGIGDRIDETVDAYQMYKDDILSAMVSDDITDIERYINNRNVLLDSIDSKFKNKYTEEVCDYIDSVAEVDACDYSSVKENIEEWQTTKHCIKHNLNAHNQFYDTIISVGIIGLVLLLIFFIVPICLWIKNKTFDIVFFTFLFIAAFNSLFESIFERQMGMIFFVFFYFLLYHVNFCQQIKIEKSTLNHEP